MNLAEIKAAAEAATRGPWGDPSWQALVPVSYEDGGDEGRAEAQANSAFIALSREAVPWLVGRVEELAIFARRVSLLDPTVGLMDIHEMVADARAALSRLEGA